MISDKSFAHLHLHTQYSLLDGAVRIENLFQKCEELNMKAVAITDHGNMYGVLDFMKSAVKFTDKDADFYDFIAQKREFKVKPIIGCELYLAEDMHKKVSDGGKMPKFNHLILLAKNEEGYHNLIKLDSLAFTEGLYYKPRIDIELLKKHTKGLICLSACLAGSIPQALLKGDFENADKRAKEFKEMFGDDFYIEIQDHNIRNQKMIIPHLVSIAKNNNIKLAATNDVHYLSKEDAKMQKVLQCISFRTTMDYDEINEDGSSDFENIKNNDEGVTDEGYFPTNEFYLKSRNEMLSVFPSLEEALDNTVEIADKCNPYFFKRDSLLPLFAPPFGTTPYQYLEKLAMEGLNKKYKTVTAEILERANYELSVIKNMGFVDYFLIVWDFIHYAESVGIPVGPGRGSGVGSIVAYSLGITKLDPLKYGLIFERFLNPERVSSPDFDIDFCVDRRGEVIDYVVEKYGKDNVSQIITFGTLAAKAAVKDVGRVYRQPYSEVEKITKLIPSMMGKYRIGHLIGKILPKEGDINPVIPELKEMYEIDTVTKNIIDMAMKIEGMPRQTGMHAAGVIICRDPIFDHIPMAKTSDDNITTQFNMVECEELGLLKMDFLGLRTLTDIKKTIDIIKATKNIEIDFYKNMEYDDAGVFSLIGEGDTHAVFQLESEGMKRFMRDLKPTSLEDIIAGISLYRPGPMDKIGEYCYGKKNPHKIKYDHILLEPILNVTYGVMVYQEQVMKIVQDLAGYSMGRADELRRIMSKKKKDKMDLERKVFLYGGEHKGTVIPGAVKNGVPEKTANKIFDDMVSFASYAFNKSHAAAYAYLSYQTAYLKKYYTVEFITAVLNNRITNIDEIKNYLSYLKDKNIEVLPPDINKSFVDFTVENGAVRIGMAAIKNVGSAVITEIVKERERGGSFTDFVEFVTRMDKITLNKKLLESLIYSGTFDCFGKNRNQLMQVYESVLDRVSKDKNAKLSGQFSFFETEVFREADTFKYPDVPEFDHADKLRYEKEVAGVYLSGHPLDEYKEYLKQFKINSSFFKSVETEEDSEAESENSAEITDGATVSIAGMLVEAVKRLTKTGKELGIGKLEDLYGTVEVLAAPHILTKFKSSFAKDKLVTITGKTKLRDDIFNIWIDKIEEWNDIKKEKKEQQRKICFYLSFLKSDPLIREKIDEVLEAYPGQDMAYIKDTDKNQLYDTGRKVKLSDVLINELYGIVGENNIKIF